MLFPFSDVYALGYVLREECGVGPSLSHMGDSGLIPSPDTLLVPLLDDLGNGAESTLELAQRVLDSRVLKMFGWVATKMAVVDSWKEEKMS